MQTFSLTLCTRNRRPFFVEADIVSRTASTFLQCCRAQEFEVLAYCFMPDHIHALVAGDGENGQAARLVRVVKQRTAYEFKQAHGLQLWQRSFFDRTLRSDADLPRAVAYIVANPVRARLVVSPGDYPFWGSDRYTREEVLEFVRCTQR